MEEHKGLLIFSWVFAVLIFTLCGVAERRLQKIASSLAQEYDDDKYVN